MLKKTKYKIQKEKIQNDAIKDFCMMCVWHIIARESTKYNKICSDKPILLPREIGLILSNIDIEKFPPENEKIGTLLGRDLHVY